MKRDVPFGKFVGDVFKVVGSAASGGLIGGGDVSERSVAGKTASSIHDYWTNDTYFKCPNCGHRLYDEA